MESNGYLRFDYRMGYENHLSNLLLRDVIGYSSLNISRCRKFFYMISPFKIWSCKHSPIIVLII